MSWKLGVAVTACSIVILVVQKAERKPCFTTPVATRPQPTVPAVADHVLKVQRVASSAFPGVSSCCILAVAAAASIGVRARARRANSRISVKDAEVSYNFQKTAYADFDFLNDVGYLPDGTPMNKAGNAINHPETIGPDRHTFGSPLPQAVFTNSVGYLPDGTAMNRAGNAINHPDRIPPDSHTAGSPLPPSSYAADVGYLADGTPLHAAGNNSFKSLKHPHFGAAIVRPPSLAETPVVKTESTGEAHHGIKFEYSFQKDVYADVDFVNDVGILPDGTAMNQAGNALNHPERMQPDAHTPGAPLPRALFTNSVGYLPDGTPLNAAGNAINHPERMQPDQHIAGSPLPKSTYAADVGYLVDGTPIEVAGNNSLTAASVPSLVTSGSTPVGAAFLGASLQPEQVRQPGGFAYSFPRNAYADFLFCNDVGYLPDGTPMNRAGNALNHPEKMQPDQHAPGTPLPRAHFVNDVGYLPDGTPLNAAGNALNHPEAIQPDLHTPGSPLPASAFAADVGYLVDGTPMDAAGNNSLPR